MQFLLNAAASSALVSLIGFAIWIVYRSRGYYDFGLLLALVGSPFLVLAVVRAGGSSFLGILVALAVCAMIGATTTFILPAAPQDRKPLLVRLTVGSYGLWLAGQGLLFAVFGDQPLSFPQLANAPFFNIRQSSISSGELMQLAMALLMWLILASLSRRSTYWIAWKATATNNWSALYYGIPAQRIIACGAGAAYVCAAVAGITQAVSIDVTPYPAFSLFLNGAVVALIAEGLSLFKLFFASVAIGSAVTLAIITVGAVWQEVFSALALFAALAWLTFVSRKIR